MIQHKCTPYADSRPCKFRSVLDGEEWCETHETYRWMRWQWRRWKTQQNDRVRKS